MSIKKMVMPIFFLLIVVTIAVISLNGKEQTDTPTQLLENDRQPALNNHDLQTVNAVSDTNDVSDLHTITFQHDLLRSNSAAPRYITDEWIAFYVDLSSSEGDSKGYILTLSRGTEEIEIIYQTEPKTYVSSLVGINNELFWVEHPSQLQMNTPWVIKSMNLENRNVRILQEGVAEDQILPPVLRTVDHRLTWMEKKIVDDIVISSAYLYTPETDQKTLVVAEELDEHDKNNRDGVFLIIQRPLEDGLLVQQSVFEKQEEHHQKTIELVYYPYDSTKPKERIISDAQGLIDFTGNEAWIVLCEEGRVRVIDRKSGEVRYEAAGEDSRLTLDSPYIVGDNLYYRYSTEQIFRMDLLTGEVEPVTESRTTTSKIFHSPGYLGFAYKKAVDPERSGIVEFNLIPLNE